MKMELREIATDLDAFDIYSVFREEKDTIFLDSSMHNNLGRYSFIGVNPFTVLKGRRSHCSVNDEEFECDVFDKLDELLDRYRIDNGTNLPLIGGCMGYIAYDIGLDMEEIPSSSAEDLVIPHLYFVFYDNLIIFDHEQRRCYVSACGMLDDPYASIDSIERMVATAQSVEYVHVHETAAAFQSNFTRETYIQALGKAIRYIVDGDIYVINMTQRLLCNTGKDSYDIYRDLRETNPAPFSAFMRLEDFDVISSSPERFLRIRGGKVETRPIKGTRPRGATPDQDRRNREDLETSAKDRAELLMIVDLERNDLSKVCKPHSVTVSQLYEIEEYSTVFQLVSTVVGELKDSVDAVHCLKACFPGGSITGAPKIRAMEIVDELEGTRRSLYTGCIGYFSFDGNADFNIVIRTIVKQDDRAYMGVGGGITCDSDEESEYQECFDKAKALLRVID